MNSKFSVSVRPITCNAGVAKELHAETRGRGDAEANMRSSGKGRLRAYGAQKMISQGDGEPVRGRAPHRLTASPRILLLARLRHARRPAVGGAHLNPRISASPRLRVHLFRRRLHDGEMSFWFFGRERRRAQHCVVTICVGFLIKRRKRNRRTFTNVSRFRTLSL